jgi:phosphatidate cytidylyltransferase
MVAVGMPAIIYGGVFYFLLMGGFLVVGAWEYVRLYRAVKYEPNELVIVGGVLVLVTARFFFAEFAISVFVILILIAMTMHLFSYESGRDQAALDFSISVAGITYLGWLGSYLLDIRNFSAEGGWWLMLVLPIVWAGDTGAYSIGAVYGKHKMAPRLSPRKSWEGYFAGVLTSIMIGAFFAFAFTSLGNRQPLVGLIDPIQGAFLGLVIGTLAPIGDLGESMLKRQGGLKDSSNIFPGHGGVLDRIDSWIWGAAIGFIMIQYFIL